MRCRFVLLLDLLGLYSGIMAAIVQYTRQEFISCCSNDVISRDARKAIFSSSLWQPGYQRQLRTLQQQQGPTTGNTSTSVPVDVHLPTTKLSPSTSFALGSVKFGLLNAQSVGNKSTTIACAIIEGGFDILLLTETWHTMSEDVALRRCVPPDYSPIDVPRPTANEALVNHGGVAAVITTSLRYKFVTSALRLTPFESVCFTLTGTGSTVAVRLIYRPGSAAVTDCFSRSYRYT